MKTTVTGSFWKDVALIILVGIALRIGATALQRASATALPRPSSETDWVERLTQDR